ncbi:MAG: aminotransferase class V-fold PLP-dependent enzyme [Flavobacteriales bacterium]|nr:aminotransferase class V-fold PLP-dependent enzyme [Flavobacteriales bacterium]
MQPDPIYLDYNATTPVDDRVLEKMIPFFGKKFGNASSHTHAWGWTAAQAVKSAREDTAELIGSEPGEIIFTSGATESLNLGILGVAQAYHTKGKHFITVSTEHKAVLDTHEALEKSGHEVTVLPVDENGLLDLNMLANAIRKDTVLVSVMMANNETGVIHPMREISDIVHSKDSLLLSDTTQAIGKIPVNVHETGIDLLSISAHKIYGPKGAGALYVRRKSPRVTLLPRVFGGGHEKGLRSGTLNVPGIVGLGEACRVALEDLPEDANRIAVLRDLLEKKLTGLSGVHVNATAGDRLPNTSYMTFDHLRAQELIRKLPYLGLATGSACTSAKPEPSHVAVSMGMRPDQALSSVRISLGRPTTEAEINTAAQALFDIYSEILTKQI